MKIAIISSGFLPAIDGVSVTQINRLQHLSDRGHQVLLLCPDYSSIPNIYPNWQKYAGHILPGVKVVNLDSASLLDIELERNVTRKSYVTVLKELTEFEPDIVHVDEPERLFTGFWQVPGVDYAKRAGIPCVSFYHTNLLDYGKDYFPAPPAVDKAIKAILRYPLAWIYNCYDLTLVSSPVTAAKVSRMGVKNVLQEKLLGLDATKFSPSLRQDGFWAENYGISGLNSQIKLVFLGRLTPDKGWKFTLKALTKLLPSDRLAIIIAGDGALRDEIAALGKLTPNVYLLGRVDPDRVPAILANSDIHVTASEKETTGLTIWEAFAAGIPAIAPRAGGVIDSIQDGKNGFLFEPQNQSDFTKKIQLLADNPDLRQAMGDRGRQDVANYTWDRAVDTLLKIWDEQIDRANGRKNNHR